MTEGEHHVLETNKGT